MENENGNRYGTGEGQGPDYHTGNREPVIVAEQPAREVTDEDSGQASTGQDGSDGWSSPVDAPLPVSYTHLDVYKRQALTYVSNHNRIKIG